MLVKYLIHGLISLVVGRILIFGASIGDALALWSLSGIYGYNLYLETKKPHEVNKDFKNRLVEVEQALQETKNKLGAFTMSNGFKR